MSKSLQIKKGKVVTKSGDKTIKVVVNTKKRHKTYGKVIKTRWTALVHDESNTVNVGDEVQFVSCRPISSRKKFRVINLEREKV